MDKKLESLMKKSFREYSEDSIYYKAILQSHNFWLAQDYYKHSNKAEIFKRIYMIRGKRKSSVLKLSADCYVNERTLYRYRIEFIEMYRYFINMLQNK